MGTFEEKRGGAHVIPVKLPNLVFYGVFVTLAKRRNLRAFRQKRVKFGKKPRVFPFTSNCRARFYSRKTVFFSNGPRKTSEKVVTFRTLYIPILHFAVQKLTFSTAGRSPGRQSLVNYASLPYLGGQSLAKYVLRRPWVAKVS